MIEAILTHLPQDHPWKHHIHFFDTVDSTNTAAKLAAAQGAPQGTVFLADRQTDGRGRMGRSFHSPAGKGIYLSVILRPQCKAAQLMHLTCATAVAVCDALEVSARIRPGIKWTNDLVHDGKKLGGILTELSLDTEGNVDYAIVGIGINCIHSREDFPPQLQGMAASLSMVTGSPVERSLVAARMIESLHTMSQTLADEIMPRYRLDCVTLGKEISLLRGEKILHGRAVDIDATGGLVVDFSDGHRETVSSGEVSIRGMYGYV